MHLKGKPRRDKRLKYLKKCKICEKGFKLKRNLDEHVYTEHGGGFNVRYKCGFCGVSAKHKKNIYRHYRNSHQNLSVNEYIIIEVNNN